MGRGDTEKSGGAGGGLCTLSCHRPLQPAASMQVTRKEDGKSHTEDEGHGHGDPQEPRQVSWLPWGWGFPGARDQGREVGESERARPRGGGRPQPLSSQQLSYHARFGTGCPSWGDRPCPLGPQGPMVPDSASSWHLGVEEGVEDGDTGQRRASCTPSPHLWPHRAGSCPGRSFRSVPAQVNLQMNWALCAPGSGERRLERGDGSVRLDVGVLGGPRASMEGRGLRPPHLDLPSCGPWGLGGWGHWPSLRTKTSRGGCSGAPG